MEKEALLILLLALFIIGCAKEIEKPVEEKREEQNQQIANPASVYCEEQGGTLRIETEEAGQYGICTLADGTECEEWAYYRGECPEEEAVDSEEIKETKTEDTVKPEKDPSLVAHWTFDEDAKDLANDNNGIIKGSAEIKSGKIGNALYFDGIDDYVDFSKETVNELGSLSKGTIAFWFNFQSILDKQTVMPIFYIGVNEKDPDNIFIIEVGHFNEQSFDVVPVPDPSNKKLYVTWIKDNKDPFLCYDSNANLEENKWHHFAVVVSENGNTGYLNGVEMANRHYNFGNSKDQSFLDYIQGEEKFMLGYGRSSYMLSPDFVYFKGALDDFRVYDKALTAEEVNGLVE